MSTQLDLGRAVPFRTARDPVSQPVLRRWCDALGVENPLYNLPDVAARTRFGRVVAPLAMLDVWTKPGLAYIRNPADPLGSAFEMLDGEGFTSAVAVSSALVQSRPVSLDETLTSSIMLESVTSEKVTALGQSRFVTTKEEFFVDGTAVGSSRFTVMKFRPSGERRASGSGASGVPRRRRHAGDVRRDQTGTVVAGALSSGSALPVVEIPVSATLIVGGALATSDYFDAHHDRDAAMRRGSRDIFMNIHTTLGLLQRCVGDWLGPDILWRSMSVRLGVPSYPGDSLTVIADVSSCDHATGATSIDVLAHNSLGHHAEGRIDVVLPV